MEELAALLLCTAGIVALLILDNAARFVCVMVLFGGLEPELVVAWPVLIRLAEEGGAATVVPEAAKPMRNGSALALVTVDFILRSMQVKVVVAVIRATDESCRNSALHVNWNRDW